MATSASATTVAAGAQDPAAAAAVPSGGRSFKGSSGSIGPLFAVLSVIMVLAVLSCLFSHYAMVKLAAGSIRWYHRFHLFWWRDFDSPCNPCNTVAGIVKAVCPGRSISNAKQQQLTLQLPSSPAASATAAPLTSEFR